MKKIFLIILFVFFLVGCGCSRDQSDTLKCNLDNGEQKRNLTITFKNDNKEVSDAIMEFTYKPDDVENAEKIIEEDCKNKGFTKCDIEANGENLTYIVSGNPKALGINTEKTIDEIKTILEKDGYTCVID